MPRGAKPKDTFDRLFDRAMVQDNGCWEFSGGKNEGGYGQIQHEGKVQLAHRVAYMICIDDIPDQLCVLHKCDNRPCVNPDHLFLGTKEDNIYDMVNKKRHGHKLNLDDISEIYALADNGMIHRVIADRYNVTRKAVSYWLDRRV